MSCFFTQANYLGSKLNDKSLCIELHLSMFTNVIHPHSNHVKKRKEKERNKEYFVTAIINI